ncbi:MAPEG family protein [Pseudoalteromonas sp. SSMSWG5]|uniref:MAPEG family protein n=1 Tax=unclassified Pseudoalteromonas TaxID=194690 RepID=UPI000C6BE9C1|nr:MULTISPECIES: MAPEG family protein [unclassified Pseudoalteromonas]MBD55399.1 glutathione metabolism protein [Pseudoalteromonas sp.]MBU76136.1 glutathione metabolism protein [Pseudoalteromonadaceae bacterium]MCO7250918.1 MAPEG family protein [Pseudoalteromonas sp. Ps84H-4]MCF2899511.1 MAPEG family protein [Pseudoalteromonas sp. OFAV1]MCF2921327.1 MAPEG family protein [Pseudoalteromonas sp. APAL1]
MIVSTFAAILAILYIQLSFRVIKIRKAKRISLGDGGDASLQAAIRTHANFIEYVPFSLILLFLLEYQGLPSHFTYILGAMLLVGRFCHSYALADEKMQLRVVGMVLTFLMIFISSVMLLITQVF